MEDDEEAKIEFKAAAAEQGFLTPRSSADALAAKEQMDSRGSCGETSVMASRDSGSAATSPAQLSA